MRLDKTKLRRLADALCLDPLDGETTERLFARCLTRATVLAGLMIADEASDPDRKDWPWSERSTQRADQKVRARSYRRYDPS